ncbi:MAG TPA: DNA (cytosine-5-)-methyltransferase [Longimicrobium sp.]
MPTAVSLFSGCGGFDWGATQAGVEVVWANDNNVNAATAYQALFPGAEFVRGDIRKVGTFPEADILIGCYPCTGFSLAARRRWRKRGERDLRANDGNFLYEEFLRALTLVQPRYLFVENVRGMRSAEGGWFLEEQIRVYSELGYKVESALLNARDFGLAQTRQRLFLVGVHEEVEGFEYEFPVPTHGQVGGPAFTTLEDAIGGMPAWPDGEYCEAEFHGHYLTRNRKRGWDQQSYTIVADSHHVPLHPMGEPMVFVEKDKWALQGDENRRLSWRECARVQGLPEDGLEVIERLDARYQAIGNAVPPVFGEVLLGPVVAHEQGVAVAQEVAELAIA